MNDSQIKYRPIQSSDYVAIEAIIRKSWKYDQFASPKIAQRLSKIFLTSCLANQTFTCVAIINEKPVGVIMGKNKKKQLRSLKYLSRHWLAVFPLLMSKEGIRISKLFREVNQIDKNFLKNTPIEFDSELAFFVLDENQRGLGIGKNLYQLFLDYLAAEELTSFFLFTDTTCNYGFYDHQGLHRLQEEKLYFPNLKETTHFYLYSNKK
ncbi:GNAT family N-acetyltransferase [Carnobacterium sp.]|uniref:GNAT family N-acetyltransferase n=1 Tax=Carnobacterium sp. TaxID=48221 RepID=UPI003C70B922